MKKFPYHGFSFFLASVSLVFLTNCASSGRQFAESSVLPEIDVLQMKENADIALKLSQQSKLDIDALNTRVAEVERMIVDLRNTIATLPLARMKETEDQLLALAERITFLQQDIEKRGRVPTFTLQQQRSEPRIQLPPAPEAYLLGTRAFDSRDYSSAMNFFRRVIADHPDGIYTDDAYYWIGESHYQLGDYAQAIAHFQKVFTFLNTDKADAAQFGLANSYLKLGDTRQAVSEYRKMEILYPNSPLTQKAKLTLRKLEN
jgi:TolA-binding protein